MKKLTKTKPKDWHYPYSGRGELVCIHGVGHGGHLHSCEGCCQTKEFKKAWKKRIAEGYRLKK